MRKHQKHYMYFLKETKELYAYTNEKKIAKEFEFFRDTSLFFKKTKMLSSSDMENLYNEQSFHILHMEDFNGVRLAITKGELIELDNGLTEIMCVRLQSVATIPIEIFNKKIQKDLKLLHYDEVYESTYGYGGSSPFEIFEQDRLGYFLHLFWGTIRH